MRVLTKRKYIEQNFHSIAGVMPQGWDLGLLGGVKNFSVGICDGAPSTAYSSLEFLSLKGGCTGSSESILVKMPHCCKPHVAHIPLYSIAGVVCEC